MEGQWLRRPTGDTTVVFVHGVLSSGDTCWRNSNGAYPYKRSHLVALRRTKISASDPTSTW
jgi:hypothetical protein